MKQKMKSRMKSRMKSKIGLWLVFGWMAGMLLLLSGCHRGAAGAPQGSSVASGANASESSVASATTFQESSGINASGDSAASQTESASDASASTPPAAPIDVNQIDVDLTRLSSTMVYSEVYNMMVYPEDYIGKLVKMKGICSVYYDEAGGKYYYACIIQDATACCAKGIEYILAAEYAIPGDYPEDGAEICVMGFFDTYQEGSKTYCTLRNATLL